MSIQNQSLEVQVEFWKGVERRHQGKSRSKFGVSVEDIQRQAAQQKIKELERQICDQIIMSHAI